MLYYRPRIEFPLVGREGRELCRGFMVRRIDRNAGKIFEVRFAVLNDGKIYRSEEGGASDWFDRDGEVWIEVDGIPVGAEFIGNYQPPRIRRAAFERFSRFTIHGNCMGVMAISLSLGLPLVSSNRPCRELSEEYFDGLWATASAASITPFVYELALVGGEPYGFWF